jgi:ATP-dependent Lhr-like helicase
MSFHPAVARWFRERIGEPTAAQRLGWDAIREGGHTLIAAPTGSGKTLAAFLHALDQLLREGLDHELPEETRVVYVSPLKALSADVHKNLAEPRREIRQLAEQLGLLPARITAAVRTGDTPTAERAAMIKHPPHILVTTPESLYLLLTAERSRKMLRTVRTVIVDEIHALIETRRGAHLALSLERLEHVTGRPLQRIGLSATARPIDVVGDWLVGGRADQRTGGHADQPRDVSQSGGPPIRPSAAIIDHGHRRALDLALELPGAPLEAVMSGEVWDEVYERLTALIAAHKTTLIFVNTRRLAERLARRLADRLGEAAVTAHHGSLARGARLDAEERLKAGQLRALVATASLELGIDIGHVIWYARSRAPGGSPLFCNEWAGRAIPSSGRPGGGCSHSPGTISWNARPCFAPCGGESWTICWYATSRSMSWLSRWWPRRPPRTGRSRSCSSSARAPIPIVISPARSSMRWWTWFPAASPPVGAAAEPWCTMMPSTGESAAGEVPG